MNGSNIIISTIKQIVQDKIHAILILKADNNYDNIVQVGLYYDTRMVIASVHDSKDMKEHLIYLIKCAERLIVFDLKDLSKNFLSSDEHAKVLFENCHKFYDIKLHTSNLFYKDIHILSDELYNISGVKAEDDTIEFHFKNSKLNNKPYQIIDSDRLHLQIDKELQILNSVFSYCNNNSSESLFLDSQHKASLVYGFIEHRGCTVDTTKIKGLSKHFSDYLEGFKTANVSYTLTGSKTGRTHSQFNSIPKKQRDVIVSENGYVVACDWKCHEVKVLFDFLNIECKSDDIYSIVADKTNYVREEVKANFIQYVYDKNINNGVTKFIDKEFGLMKKIREHKNSIEDKKQVEVLGKRYIFESESDFEHKFTNYFIQTCATFLTNCITFNMLEALIGSGTKIIAIIHDEIVLDVPKENFTRVYKIIKQYLNFETSNVKYVSDIHVGKNFKEMIYVNK